MAARATLALKAGVWLRRGLLLIVSPVRGYHRRYQAETPLIDLFKFASPALCPKCQTRMVTAAVEEGPEGFEHRSLECSRCGHSEQNVIASDPMNTNALGWLNSELHPPK